MTLLINLYGAPGSGKSTMAAHVFALLKYEGVNCELVTEYAKELCWEGRLKNTPQRQIFEGQFSRIKRLIGKVDVIITDSPIRLSYFYGRDVSFLNWADVMERNYNISKVDYFVCRVKEYNPKGRLQSKEESNKVAKDMLCDPKLKIRITVPGNKESADLIFRETMARLERLEEND